MATWNVATEGHPIFASPNYLTQDAIDNGTFIAEEMTALIERIIDGDPESYWQGSTQVDGDEVIVGPFSFHQGASIISRTFDLVVLQNINWERFIGEYSTDGLTWSTITGLDYTGADNAATDLVVNIPGGLTGKYVRFRVTDTITANAKKKCGGIIVCAGVVQPAGGYTNYKVKGRESVRELVLGDGTVSREYIMRSAASYDFWGAMFDLLNVTEAELTLLRTIKRQGNPFILIPEPGDKKRDAYLCHFDGPWAHELESSVRSIGYRVPVKVKEVGSH